MTRFSTRNPGYSRGLYPKKTAGSTVRASRDARTVRPESPLFFSRKRKGRAKRKLPADVRKLKNDCEVRGKRTRRARFAAAVRLAIQLQVLDRYTSAQTSFSRVRPSPPFFFPLSPIGRTGLRALLILYGNSVFKRYPRCSTYKQHLSGPRIECGVTPLVMRSDAVSINIWGESYCCYSSYVMNWSPHRVRGDTLSHTAPRRGIQKYLGERVPVVIPLMP